MEHINPLTDLKTLRLRASEAQVVTWGGREALRLSGLALLPYLEMTRGRLEVDIAAEAAAYPGLVFHAQDQANYELAYAQPHTSGLWDALQYDPVFHDSNTWQLYHGAGNQKEAQVPMGSWFTLKLSFAETCASLQIGDQPPLLIPRLAHSACAGSVGLWTYLPAYYSNLRVSDSPELPTDTGPAGQPETGAILDWYMEGFGRISCDPSGYLVLNRTFPVSLRKVSLSRQFMLSKEGSVELSFGFSDILTLQLDNRTLFHGQNLFSDFGGRPGRGYVEPGAQRLVRKLKPGLHRLTARLRVKEYFGWGLALALTGEGLELLPSDMG